MRDPPSLQNRTRPTNHCSLVGRVLLWRPAAPVHLIPCNCSPPASVWIATKCTTGSDARTARQRHLRTSPAGCRSPIDPIDPIDRIESIAPIDRRHVHGRQSHRARKLWAPIVRCCCPTSREAESGRRSGAARSAWHCSELLDGCGGKIGQATSPIRPPATNHPSSNGHRPRWWPYRDFAR